MFHPRAQRAPKTDCGPSRRRTEDRVVRLYAVELEDRVVLALVEATLVLEAVVVLGLVSARLRAKHRLSLRPNPNPNPNRTLRRMEVGRTRAMR